MSIRFSIRRFALLLVLPLLLTFGGVASAAYTDNTYGSCLYGVSTGGCDQHTIITTPNGLQIAVNLVNGQVIPTTGYDVTITPLNGRGDSFASADIYIAGVKVATVYPQPGGTAIWHWDTQKYRSGDIKIVVLDTAGNTTNVPFTVTVSSVAPSTSGGTDTSSGNGQSQPWFGAQIADAVAGQTKNFIRLLPPRVVDAFPYLLFLLILLEIAILTYQTRRELREQKKLESLAEREREVIDMKQKFTALVSHYLRTPLTILQGGAEGYAAEPAAGANGKQLALKVKAVHDSVESIISHTSTEQGPSSVVVSSAREASKIGIGKLLAVWLPVVFVGLLATLFIYLATSINRYDANAIKFMTQIVVFSILAVMVYLVLRQWQLHRNGVAAARLVLEQELAVHSAQDSVIGEAATELARQKAELQSLVAALPKESSNAQFVRSGFTRLSKTIDKFVIASKLKGSVSTDPPVTTALDGIVAQASSAVMPQAQKKHVVIRTVQSADIVSRNAALVTLVLQSLIDNAVAYSNDNGTVEVGTDVTANTTELYVADHGPGIAPEELDTLFQPFSRIEEVETFNREGLGFSLYLDKLIMSYLGGTISVDSKPREETRFVLTLPSTPTQTAK